MTENIALLPKVALVLGPYAGPTDYDVVTAWLVDEVAADSSTYVMYATGDAIYFAQADKLRDSLYAAAESNTVDFFYDEEREPVAVIAEIVGKLRSMSALDYMRELVRTPGDHAIYV